MRAISRTLALAVLAALSSAAGVARADAAADVSDIRAGRFPTRHELLGWDAAGHAHVRTLLCSTGGTDACRAQLLDVAPSGASGGRDLLDIVEVYCDGRGDCPALDRATAASFVAKEGAARRALPPLTTTPPASDPSTLLGTIAGAATRVEVDAIVMRTAEDGGPVVSVRLVARGAGGATETLAVLASDQRFSSGKATAAYLSPDGKRALVVAGFETGAMCWDFQHLNVVAVDLPRRRASLANTIGFRAWKRGDMPAALAAFKESTRLDPSFGLGAFNRAAVESRTGDLAAAGQSFRTAVALDASAAARACKDHDFDALRAAEPALMACR